MEVAVKSLQPEPFCNTDINFPSLSNLIFKVTFQFS